MGMKILTCHHETALLLISAEWRVRLEEHHPSGMELWG